MDEIKKTKGKQIKEPNRGKAPPPLRKREAGQKIVFQLNFILLL